MQPVHFAYEVYITTYTISELLDAVCISPDRTPPKDTVPTHGRNNKVDLSEYTLFTISGARWNCFFMTAFVTATLNGEPLGGGDAWAYIIRSVGSGEKTDDLKENLEAEGLKVRQRVVEFLRGHKSYPVPAHFRSGRKGPQRRAQYTWEDMFHALRSPEESFDGYVDWMSQSGCWGSDFEQRVLVELGQKVSVAKGEDTKDLGIFQQAQPFQPLRKGESVWYHVDEEHYNVLIAPSE